MVSELLMARSATPDDLDRIFEIARAAYPAFDEDACRQWALGAFQSPNITILVGRRAFGVSGITAPFYAPARKRGTMLFLAAERGAGYEPCAILRRMVRWAMENGSLEYRFGAETDARMVVFAKRLGAQLDKPSWVIGV